MLSGISCTLSAYLLHLASSSAKLASRYSADFFSIDESWPRLGIGGEESTLLDDWCLKEGEED